MPSAFGGVIAISSTVICRFELSGVPHIMGFGIYGLFSFED